MALTFTVGPHAAEDGFGKLSQGDSCVEFRYVGTALTSVRVASGARIAFILLKKGEDHPGCVGTAPESAINFRDLADHEGGLGVYIDGEVRTGGESLDGARLPHINEGDLVVLEGLPNMEVQMWVNGIKHYKWVAKEDTVFAVSGVNGTAWKVRPAPSREAPPPQAAPAAPPPDVMPAPSQAAPAPNQDLIEASGKGNVEEVQRLIADGADVRHFAPMHAAARRGHVKVLNVLIEAGADKDVVDTPSAPPGAPGLLTQRQATPMHTAAMYGQVKVVQALIEAGANKDAREPPDMKTPMHVAAHYGHEKVVKALCDAGADKEARTAKTVFVPAQTAMHEAVRHPKVLKVLLQAGASDEALTTKGKSPLDLARSLRCKASVTLLEKAEKQRKEDSPAKRQRLS